MNIDYTYSGVKTLRYFSPLMLLCGIIAAIYFIPDWIIEINRAGDTIPNWSMILLSVVCFVFGLIFTGLCLALATIAENALYQKQKDEELEEQNEG